MGSREECSSFVPSLCWISCGARERRRVEAVVWYMCVFSVVCLCMFASSEGKVPRYLTDEQGNAGLYTVLTCGLDAISLARGANAAATSGSSWSGILTWAWGCGCGIDIGMYVLTSMRWFN